jgi:uroporphyrinogen-III synthase
MEEQNILVTRKLTDRQRKYARSLGLNVIEKPALEFEFPIRWDDILKTISEHPESDWVFTSKNGVKALKKMINSGLQILAENQVFAVGTKTQKALQNLDLGAKIPRKQDSAHLAEFIIENGKSNSVIYFHGNLIRDDMSRKLTEDNIEVIETEVYKTVIHPVKLPSEPVGAILFYSPSAVEGFKRGEGFEGRLPPLFAIGPTTAKVLEKETNQPIKIAKKPDTKVLLQTVSNYLFHSSDDSKSSDE